MASIGELFVNLGIKGTEKTVGALTSVKEGLGSISSMSIEAKAGILGALYGLEKLTAASGAMGTNLTNFTALTGISTKALQQWQYAARQAGVSGQEMESSLKGVQGVMTNMLLGNGQPAGLGAVASKVGFDVSKARDTQYVLGQLQKYAQSVSPELASQVVKTFGVSEGVIAGMRRNAFRPDVFNRAPSYGDKEVASLDKANIAWSNLGNKIEMAVGHFNARHGAQLVQDISKITDQVLRLVDAFTQLAEKLKVFEAISKAFEVSNSVLEDLNKGKSSKILNNGDLWHIGGAIDSLFGKTPQNIQINQNLNFQHDGKDAQKTGHSVHHAVKGAFRQMPQNGGF